MFCKSYDMLEISGHLTLLSEQMILPENIRWLKLIPAAKYSAIGRNRLKALAAKGIIKGFRDLDSKRRDWIFDKESLDSYRQNQASRLDLKAKEILDTL